MSHIALSCIPASLDKKKYQSWSPALQCLICLNKPCLEYLVIKQFPLFCLSNILKHTEEQTDHAAMPMADGAWFWVVVPDC